MSQSESSPPTETGKILGSIYGSLIILFAVLLFLSTIFTSLTTDAAMRSFYLIFVVGAFLILIGAELAKILFKSGVTIIGFLGFLVFNLLMIIFGLAVFVDIVVPTVMDTTIQMVLLLLVGSLIWYVILVLISLREWKQKK
ncbi:hypothetical protein EU528_03630 [Candidatus Thorarchaeota archaeon]|nr:MAG: hypothetical protein EU528_03630 [Candidatus Thorarchaeota archaeon]